MDAKLESTASDLTLFRDEVLKGTEVSDFHGNTAAVLVPDGYKLELTERLNKHPSRMRAQFAADSIAEFVGYVGEHADDLSRVFVDPAQLEALAVLDYGIVDAPRWGQHRAHCKLRLDECYRDLRQALTTNLSPEAVVDLILDHPAAFRFSAVAPEEWLEHAGATGADTDEGAMTPQQAVQALRKLKTHISRESAHESTDTSRNRSTLERAAVTNRVPLTLIAHCQPAPELDAREFLLRLRYRLEGDKPIVSLRLLHKGQVEQAIAADFRDKLRAALGEDGNQEPLCAVHVGTLASWQ